MCVCVVCVCVLAVCVLAVRVCACACACVCTLCVKGCGAHLQSKWHAMTVQVMKQDIKLKQSHVCIRSLRAPSVQGVIVHDCIDRWREIHRRVHNVRAVCNCRIDVVKL